MSEKAMKELETMVRCTTKLDDAIVKYMSHRLQTKIQFGVVFTILESMKGPNTSTLVLIDIDQKQKTSVMRQREAQVDYYRNKRMSDLDAMIVKWLVIDGVCGFQYKFINCMFKEYNARDNLQVAYAIQELARR